MADQPSHDEFVLLVIGAQNRLFAYIYSLLLDRERARDVLQQTNLVLLEKEHQFTPGTNFVAWASKVAFYEVLAERRSRQRDKLLFSDDLLALIANSADHETARHDRRASALADCLEKLPAEQQALVRQRYSPGGSVADLAAKLNKTPNAISAALHRVRSALVECVERRMNRAEAT